MNKEEIEERLKQINIEDYIWLIYIGIIFFSWYSNYLERDSLINNNKHSKSKYRTIIISIFSVLVVVYYYFFKSSLEDLKEIKPTDKKKKKQLVYLSFIASLLILISGLIFLYIAIYDKDNSIELAFN